MTKTGLLNCISTQDWKEIFFKSKAHARDNNDDISAISITVGSQKCQADKDNKDDTPLIINQQYPSTPRDACVLYVGAV